MSSRQPRPLDTTALLVAARSGDRDAYDLVFSWAHDASMGAALGGHGGGTLDGVAFSTNGTYIVQAFASPSCDPSGFGEGRVALGSTVVQIRGAAAGASQAAAFHVPLVAPPGLDLLASQLTATATDAAGNSSELGSCVTMTYGGPILVDGFESGSPSAWIPLGNE